MDTDFSLEKENPIYDLHLSQILLVIADETCTCRVSTFFSLSFHYRLVMLYDIGAGEDFSRRGGGGGQMEGWYTVRVPWGCIIKGHDHKMLPFDNGNLQCFKTFTTEILAILERRNCNELYLFRMLNLPLFLS